MKKWFQALGKTRESSTGGILKAFRKDKITEDELEELEESLISADIPIQMVDEWMSAISRMRA